jgi:excisionase family DNA binding protein
MEHRFIKFEEAVEKLGISADRLNQLREDGDLRAYRDGASWKFRADEIDRLVEEGVPEPAPPSDIGLVDESELVDASALAGLPELEGDELGLASDDELSLESDLKLGSRDQGGSELELADLDDETVTAGASDPKLKDADEPSDPSDSILLSEEALGESSAPPSTIIGKSELESKDADLELVTDDADESDVKLSSGASEVLSSHVAGSGVLDDLEKSEGNTSAFEGLEELELDLAAESGRILGGQEAEGDFAAEVGVAKGKPKGDSDLTLKDVELAGEDEGTDPIPAALDKGAPKAKKDAGPTSDLELATDEDDDFVLAEAGGSDITLDSADSGINLIDPSDSGLALDDIPLEMGGSAILESLSLGSDKADADISLVGDAPAAPVKPRAKLQTDDDFRLTPLGDREEDGDSSSQVIALDAGMEDLGAGDAGILGEDVFAEEPEGVVLTEDYEGEPGAEFGAYAGAAPRTESEYSVMNILGLGSCMVLLLLGVIVMMDMIRNIWSWDQNLALNDSLLDSLLGLFGLS